MVPVPRGQTKLEFGLQGMTGKNFERFLKEAYLDRTDIFITIEKFHFLVD